ncbi:plasmid mobilization relaxosome protein MobC [Sphingobacterium sp. PCS056]|uniref:plasmid mobilization protein n=1 Tax=Sphingobacterium sp. PCS056 TaxID=2931400 RepID=UPI00200F6F8C|nr:plasmid mobilization relaxosome protein MobC [Sphingobacterium sp. PCS056]UPZ36519.1 plasmid mobilization relaxosome protein MobC [Sphingobacterium sp. PCS056]
MENQAKTKWLHVRLSEEEYRTVNKHFGTSTSRKLSQYVRDKLLERPIVKAYRDKSNDDLMAELIPLRLELNRIGNNYNQAVKKLHTLKTIGEFKAWIMQHDIEKQTLFNKIEEIKNLIQKYAERWLQ